MRGVGLSRARMMFISLAVAFNLKNEQKRFHAGPRKSRIRERACSLHTCAQPSAATRESRRYSANGFFRFFYSNSDSTFVQATFGKMVCLYKSK